MTDGLNKRIMRRVYAVWFARNAAPVLFLQIPVLLIIALHETAREFFVARIIENFLIAANSGGISAAWNFGISALQSAPFVPVLIILFSLGLCGVLGYRLARNIFNLKLVRIY